MTQSQHAKAVAATVANAQVNRLKPTRRSNVGPPTPKPKHSISTIKPIRHVTPAASRRQATPARPVAKSRASACPNPTCTSPNVEDGVCHSCGTIVNESNIVSEVTFGENASGAAVLQGTFIGDGKTHANTMGAGFNRLGGSGNDSGGHLDAMREGTEVINGLKQAFSLDEAVLQFGLQIFKSVAGQNFCQGRRIATVAACSLYAAARCFKSEQYNSSWRDYQCKVMIIDFADHLGINAFHMGRVFKAMLTRFSLLNIPMIIPEDLMMRFASKLDFGLLANNVAETATKLAQRMQQDWMLTGRRPAGICGACILMAARIHNFRRTVQEVVYIVKVTHSTIEKRLDEFKYTAASGLTVDEFLNNAPATSEHDPPAFYQQTEEYKKTRKTRKRKRGTETHDHEDDEDNEDDEEDADGGDRTSSSSSSSTPGPTSQPQLDADGFTIPALPPRKKAYKGDLNLPIPTSSGATTQGTNASADSQNGIAILPSLLNQGVAGDIEDLAYLARNLGDSESPPPEEDITTSTVQAETNDDDIEAEIEETINSVLKRPETLDLVNQVVATHLKAHPPVRSHIEAQFNDPNSEVHKLHFEIAKHQADLVSQAVATSAALRLVSMDVHIGEDEFADDDEVVGCLLSPEEVNIKEKIWYNENKDWLVRQLERDQKKKEDEKRPKVRRVRKKIDKIGEGQKEPMASSHEAAIAALERRTGRNRGGEIKSKKINYKAIQDMMNRENGSVPSSTSTSRATSVTASRTKRAGSAKLAASVARSRAGSVATSVATSVVSSVVSMSEYNSDVGSMVDVGNSMMDQFGDDDDMDDVGFTAEDMED